MLWLHTHTTTQTEGHWLYVGNWPVSQVQWVYSRHWTHRNTFSPYCGLSQPKTVVYMPQISTHKHHSLEGSENASQRSLPTDYAMIYVVWKLWPRQAVNKISGRFRFGQNKHRTYYAFVKHIYLKSNIFHHFISSWVFPTLVFHLFRDSWFAFLIITSV